MTDNDTFIANAMRARITRDADTASCDWCRHFTPNPKLWCTEHSEPPATYTSMGNSTCPHFSLGPNWLTHD